MRKIRTHHNHPQGKIFSWMVLIFGLGGGLILPIFPNFVKTIVHTDAKVSGFYAAMAIVMFLSAIFSTIIFKKVQRTTITNLSFLLGGLTLFFLIFVTSLTELTIVKTISVWFSLFLIMSLSLFVRDFAKKNDLGAEEGVFYRFHNIGAMLGPLIGGFMAVYMGYEIVFILAAFVMLAGLSYFYSKHIIQKHPAIVNERKQSTRSMRKNIKEYFENTERIKSYFVTFIMMVFIGFKRLYIPLYVIYSGYIESMSGLILALSIVPMILMEVKVGEYADKHGVRIPISAGFLIIAVSLIAIFFSPFPLLNFLLFIIGNIGAALVEPLQEYYLFKSLPESKEDDLYGVYMTADPIAYFVTPLIGMVLLVFLPFKFIFLGFGILTLGAAGLTWSMIKH